MNTGNPARKRSGMALWVVFIVLVVLFIAGMTISQLMQGVQKQLEYADASVRALYIAESGLNYLVGRLMAKPWDQRWYLPGTSDTGSSISLGGGTYDYFLQDTPGKKFFVDIWVRSYFKTTRRLFFWRVKYQTGLLASLSRGSSVSSSEVDNTALPTTGTVDTMTQQIEALITKRNLNEPMAEVISKDLQQSTNAQNSVVAIGGTPGGLIQNNPMTPPGLGLPPFAPPPPPPFPFPLVSLPPLQFPDTDPKQKEKMDKQVDKHFADYYEKGAKKDKVTDFIKKIKDSRKNRDLRGAEKALRQMYVTANPSMKPPAGATGGTGSPPPPPPPTGGGDYENWHDRWSDWDEDRDDGDRRGGDRRR